MARVDSQARADDQPQPVRDDLLHAGRLSCPARDGRRSHYDGGARPGPAAPGRGAWRRAGRVVLAFRGRGVDRGVHGGLPGAGVGMASEPETHEHDAVEMPTPTVAPMVLALGLTLLAAGIVTSPEILVAG